MIKQFSTLLMYPNPTDKNLTVSSDQPIDRFEILDLQGRMLFTFDPNSESFNVDVSSLNSGLYILHLFTEHGQIMKKFFKY